MTPEVLVTSSDDWQRHRKWLQRTQGIVHTTVKNRRMLTYVIFLVQICVKHHNSKPARVTEVHSKVVVSTRDMVG